MMRFLVRESLEPCGFRVTEASSGQDGLLIAEQTKPAVILLDVQMEGLDGYTVCSRLRVTPFGQHVPILMMTGLDDVDSIQHAYQVGATDFVTKPLNFTLLVFRLHYVLRAKALGDELRAKEATLAAAQRIARLGHWEYVPDNGFTRWHDSANEVLGIPGGTQVTTSTEYRATVVASDQLAVRNYFQKLAHGVLEAPLEYRVTTLGGTKIIRQHVQPTTQPDGTTVFIGTVQDVTELRSAERQIHDLAYYDQVTGLPNRQALDKHLNEVLAVARQTPLQVAVLLLNLDHFQRINDHLGHSRGNELLKACARRLSSSLRNDGLESRLQPSAYDFIARNSADEFCLVIAQEDVEGGSRALAARMHDNVRRPFLVDDEELQLSASIGVAWSSTELDDGEELLRAANLALHQAKRQGRDTTVFHTAQLNARAKLRLSLETKLRQALGTAQLSLHYQPKFDAHSLALTGMEALLRWEHPELGFVSPAQFIPIAEETSLILPLGDWVLHTACEQLAAWRNAGLGAHACAVNLSAAQFRDPDLPQRIARIINETGISPAQLELELTESLVMRDEAVTNHALTQLRQLGIGLAIDDFGTGYSSLGYLKRLPVDIVKIDQSFVRGLQEGTDDAAIVQAIIALAHSLRLKVVAEGVEQPGQLQLLQRQGCEYVQGFLLARPMPAAAFEQWLREEPRLASQPYRGRHATR